MTANVKKTKLEAEPVREEIIALLDRDARVAELAYYKAEKRGFEPGYEMDDWLEAERELAM